MIRFAVFAVSALWVLNSFAQAMTSTQLYDSAVEITSNNFYDQTFRGLDWPRLAQSYRSRVSDESSLQELKLVLNELLGNLNASHTKFLTSDDQDFHALQSIFSGKIDGNRIFQCGGWYRQLGHKWFVQNVLFGSPMQRSGLLSGDEIVSVDGRSFEEIKSCNTHSTVTIKYRRSAHSKEKTVKLTPVFQSAQELLLHATVESEKIWKVGNKKIGYFHLWSGTDDLFLTSLQAAVARMASTTDALILDLRDGFGGAWTPYIQQFFDHDLETGAPLTQVYSKPVYVLINGGVRSGKEYLAFLLKDKKRATLIGTNTAGYFLRGRLFDLEKGSASLYLAVAGDPTGLLEGRGVAPDIEVTHPLPYRQGADDPLDKALELAKTQVSQELKGEQ